MKAKKDTPTEVTRFLLVKSIGVFILYSSLSATEKNSKFQIPLLLLTNVVTLNM